MLISVFAPLRINYHVRFIENFVLQAKKTPNHFESYRIEWNKHRNVRNDVKEQSAKFQTK